MDKPLVLILCTGNSCRSQIAEGILRRKVGDLVSVESAGSDPAKYVHPKAIQVRNELGIDISKNRSKHLSEFLHRKVHTVITDLWQRGSGLSSVSRNGGSISLGF
jgi:arsenate reductase